MFWRKPKGPRNRYVRAKKPGTVTKVQRGTVSVGTKEYADLHATFVRPGQVVAKGQVIGKRIK